MTGRVSYGIKHISIKIKKRKGDRLVFKNIEQIFRVYVLGLIGVFSFYILLLNFKTSYIWSFENEVPFEVLLSAFLTVSISSYYFLRWNSVYSEYTILKNKYLNWVIIQPSWKVFLVSIPLNFSLSLCQFGIIKLTIYYFNVSIPVASNISLAVICVVSFFQIRTFVFWYTGKNYLHQGVCYCFVVLISLIVNYFVVKIFQNQLVFAKEYIPFIVQLVGEESFPQLCSSACLGILWFKLHQKITFTHNFKERCVDLKLKYFSDF